MPENQQPPNSGANKNAHRRHEHKPITKAVPKSVWIVAVAVFVGSLVLLGVVAHYRVAENSYRIKFFAESSLNLFILFAITVQAYIYIRQWDAMERNLERTDDIIDAMLDQLEVINKQEGHLSAQAEAAKTQAETMTGQLEAIKQQAIHDNLRFEAQLEQNQIGILAAEKSAQYAQRAYVYAKIGQVIEDVFDVTLLIENSGNSPANDVRLSYRAEFRERDPHKDTGDWDSFHSPYHNPRRIGLLPPKIYFPETIYHRPVPTPDDLRKYYKRNWNYHVWGEIAYRDVFRNEWYTSFAFYVTAIGNMKVTVMPGLTGNEAT